MPALKNLVRSKCKAAPGTTVNCLGIPAIHLSNNPRTVFEKDGATVGYTAAVGDRVRLSEAFTYETVDGSAAKFAKFKVNIDSGGLNYETVGEKGFEAYKNMGSGEIVGGSMDEVREFVDFVNDFCGMVVLMEMRDSQDWAVLGSKDNPVYFNFKGDIGKKAGDKNVAAFELNDEGGKVFRTYPKALALSVHT
jgi:hypothetical protein